MYRLYILVLLLIVYLLAPQRRQASSLLQTQVTRNDGNADSLPDDFVFKALTENALSGFSTTPASPVPIRPRRSQALRKLAKQQDTPKAKDPGHKNAKHKTKAKRFGTKGKENPSTLQQPEPNTFLRNALAIEDRFEGERQSLLHSLKQLNDDALSIEMDLAELEGEDSTSVKDKALKHIATRLVEKWRDPTVPAKEKFYPVSLAASVQHTELLHCLLTTFSLSPNQRDDTKKPPIAWAIETDNPQILTELLDAGADLETTILTDELIPSTPLGVAVGECSIETVKLLLDAKADLKGLPEKRLAFGAMPDMPPLHRAAKKGREDVVDLLLKYGADVNLQYQGLPALGAAVDSDRMQIAQKLIAAGTDFTQIEPVTALKLLGLSMKNNSPGMLDLLLELKKIDLDAFSPESSALGWAIEAGPWAVERLLAHHADPNVPLQNANTDTATSLLSYAITHPQDEHTSQKLVTLLLESGANPNGLTTQEERTPFYWAARLNRPETAKLLLNKGAYPTASFTQNIPLAIEYDRTQGSLSLTLGEASLKQKADIEAEQASDKTFSTP